MREDDKFASLLQTLESASSILTRSIAALELGDFGDLHAIAPLRKCLDETDREIVGSAIQALGKLKDNESILRFLSFLDNSHHKWVRIDAIGALCNLNYLLAEDYFRKMLDDADNDVRLHAMMGLLTLSDGKWSEIKADLVKFLSDPYAANREFAQNKLDFIKILEDHQKNL